MNVSRKKIVGAVVGMVLAGLIGFGLWAASTPEPERLYGEVEVREIRVAAKIGGRVDAVHVREGDTVKQGDHLFDLDGPEIRARLAQARAAGDAAEAQRDKADTGARDEEVEMALRDWKRAEAQAELAESTYRRTRNLHDEGLISRQNYEEARAQYRASKEQAEAAQAQYRMAREGARDEDRRASDAQARQAAAAVAEAEAMEAETRGHAPRDGEVAEILSRPGEMAPAGFPVLTLIDPDDTWVVFNVREDALGDLRPGTDVTAYVPALGQDVTFRVSRLNALPGFATWKQAAGTPGYDLRTFQVEARPVDAVDGLRAGMTVILERS